MAKAGKPSPLNELDTRIDVGVNWYLEMYYMLDTSRGQNNYVPISEILAVANNYELFGSKEQFVTIIQALDVAYVAAQRKKDG